MRIAVWVLIGFCGYSLEQALLISQKRDSGEVLNDWTDPSLPDMNFENKTERDVCIRDEKQNCETIASLMKEFSCVI